MELNKVIELLREYIVTATTDEQMAKDFDYDINCGNSDDVVRLGRAQESNRARSVMVFVLKRIESAQTEHSALVAKTEKIRELIETGELWNSEKIDALKKILTGK